LRVTFDLVNCGLGNQGGSQTIVKSANALVKLGHEVFVIDSMKNQHTWTPLKARHLIVKRSEEVPDAEVLVATGYKTVKHVLNLPKRCGKKFHYIRGWETWQLSEYNIVRKVLEVPTIKIVNSECLYNKLKQNGIESYIVRPGNDLDDFFSMNIRSEKEVIIGGLYHTKHTTKRTDWIFQAAKVLKSKFKNIKFYMFGINKDPHNPLIDKYYKEPNIHQKNVFYNKVSIWLAPTMLEGLHIVPQEFMLTEGTVVGTDAEMSGMQDYLTHEKTGIVSKDNLGSFVKQIVVLLQKPDLRKKLGQKGREKIIELGNREVNMEKMVKVFERFI